jgi:integrase
MPSIQLTDLSIRALKSDAQTDYWDTKMPGFGIRVGKRAKTFVVKKDNRRINVGRYPDISLADAKREGRRIIAEASAPPRPRSLKFAEAVKEFIEQHYADKRPRVRAEAKRLLESHFGPAFDRKDLASITDKEIGGQLAKLAHVPSEQLHAFRALRTFLRWCTRPPRRYLPHSPLEGYEAPSQDRKGKRILSDRELMKVWEASEGQYGAMVRLLILWGARNGEVARIRRSWIENGVLTIPGEFTKNHRDHAIPLLPMALAILEAQPNTGDFYFPGHWDFETHFQDGSWGKLKKEIVARSGVRGWQMRDIRRTFRSNLPKIGVSRDLAERLLNHVSGTRNELDEIYDRYDYLDEKRRALGKWEAKLAALMPLQVAAA